MDLRTIIKNVLREARVPREERIQLYKDKNIIIVVPLTHKALRKYATKCKWCINNDYRSEWEDYQKGKHVIIIQRNPKSEKIGITGKPTFIEIFVLDSYLSDIKAINEILNFNFENRKQVEEYLSYLLDDINNFDTNIMYYAPNSIIFDKENNPVGDFGYKLEDVPNITPEAIEILNSYFNKPDLAQ